MSKPKTHVLMIVDDSGSMMGMAEEVRSGFNRYIRELRDDTEVKYRVTAVKFGIAYEVLCANAKLADVPELTTRNYHADQGGTALYDAIGKALADFDKATVLKDGERAILVVQTDGQENSSKEFTAEQVKAEIQRREASPDWLCVFMGAGASTWQQGGGLGFQANSVLRTQHTKSGTAASYAAASAMTRGYSRGADREEVAVAAASVLGEDARTDQAPPA